ncbi:MAG: LLM class flavin-dependent oxidoreductase [Promethearchaeota archaeon]
MKIGVHMEPHVGYTFQEIANLVQKAEELKFHHFTVSDHFFSNPSRPPTTTYEAWTLVALLTPLTDTIRLGTQVTCQSYRNPALLAKIVANIDNASNGRIDLGIGAGWKEAEYRAYGYEFPSTGTRIAQLRETLEIITRLWTEDQPPSFQGKYYRIDEAKFLPKPVQSPHVPIWVGTQTLKAPKMERIIAKYADGIIYEQLPIEELRKKQERMKDACKAQGRDYKTLKWDINVASLIWKEEKQFDKIKQRLTRGNPELTEEKLDSLRTRWLCGPIEKVKSEIQSYEANKVDRLTLCLPMAHSCPDLEAWGIETLELLAQHLFQ